MNPYTYQIANGKNDNNTAPGFRGKHFDFVGSPIQYQYSEVHWRGQQTSLPSDIVNEFKGKIMVITGYETDVVRADGKGGYESVPCYQHYNHHYSSFLHGSGARMFEDPNAPFDVHSAGKRLPGWKIDPAARRAAQALVSDDVEVPHAQVLSEGNGNEHRGSYKGFPSQFGQLLYSPAYLTEGPMMINTNKDLTPAKGTPGVTAGAPVPRSSLAPPGANYSGILECPCTSRTVKQMSAYNTMQAPCPANELVTSVQECTEAAAASGLAGVVATNVSDVTLPPGCSAQFDATTMKWTATFNTAVKPTGICTAGSNNGRAMGTLKSAIGLHLALDVDATTETVTMTMSGPADVWFGFGFNATQMSDLPYAITVEGTSVHERKLGNHVGGSELAKTVTVISNNVTGAVRTVVLKRALKGTSGDYFTFSPSVSELNVINAIGSAPAYAFHKNRSGDTMVLGQVGHHPLCLCRDAHANAGKINGVTWHNPCAPYPVSNLMTQNNSICSVAAYNGGLYCCRDKYILLDADQDVPPTVETIYFKYRFYYTEYTPAKQFNLYRVWWSTEAYNNEYDVPPSKADCMGNPELPHSACQYVIKSVFKGSDMISNGYGCMNTPPCINKTKIANEEGGKFVLMYAALHCHAPGCEYAELHDLDSGEIICRNNATYGEGVGAHDEANYVVGIPPCVWGEHDGLNKAPVIHLDGNYSTIKYVNNSVGHYGVMALWQMRATYLSDYEKVYPSLS